MEFRTESAIVHDLCLPFLQASRNSDAGWGFHANSESRVEPTAWAVLALRETGAREDLWQGGCRFLRAAQLPDGSWPSSRGQSVGSWATALSCWALARSPESREAVAAGLRWICDDWPRDSNLLQRLIRKISAGEEVVSQNGSLRGWGWTPHTASWVVPTSFALIALDYAAAQPFAGAAKRRKLGRALLYDRMCPGGGWNSGNPMVYGATGEPLVEPTVWALLALHDEPNRRENMMSLEWLENNLSRIQSLRSLALARMCYAMYARRWPTGVATLRDLYEKNEFLDSIPAMAWTCLSLSADGKWLKAAPAKKR
jgi:hypothetical protein